MFSKTKSMFGWDISLDGLEVAAFWPNLGSPGDHVFAPRYLFGALTSGEKIQLFFFCCLEFSEFGGSVEGADTLLS